MGCLFCYTVRCNLQPSFQGHRLAAADIFYNDLSWSLLGHLDQAETTQIFTTEYKIRTRPAPQVGLDVDRSPIQRSQQQRSSSIHTGKNTMFRTLAVNCFNQCTISIVFLNFDCTDDDTIYSKVGVGHSTSNIM